MSLASSESDDFDALRRAVYGPNPDPQLVQRYEALVAQRAVAPVRTPDSADPVAEPGSSEAEAPAPLPVSRRRRVLTIVIPAAVVIAAVVFAAVQATVTASQLPESVTAPDLAGTSIVDYGILHVPTTDPRGVRYDPYGYTVFTPSGGSLHVALRCVGTGRVVITAGQRFTFRCPGPETVLHLDDETAHATPFVVGGITTGDVVWAVRITERPVVVSKRFNSDCATCVGAAGDSDWKVRFGGSG